MKLTIVTFLVGLIFVSSSSVRAAPLLQIDKIDIQKVQDVKLVTPTPTPTNAVLIKDPIIKVTIVPRVSVVLTQAVTNTPTPTATVTEKPSITPTIGTESPTITTAVTLTSIPTTFPSPTVMAKPVSDSNGDLTRWFLIASVILLVIIVIAQSWPNSSDNEDKPNQ